MTSREYATIPLIEHATKQILNQWGENSWETVQVICSRGARGVPQATEGGLDVKY